MRIEKKKRNFMSRALRIEKRRGTSSRVMSVFGRGLMSTGRRKRKCLLGKLWNFYSNVNSSNVVQIPFFTGMIVFILFVCTIGPISATD